MKKGSTEIQLKKHSEERAFYDLSGEENIVKYMTTLHKLTGEGSTRFTFLEYLQKSTGVFNDKGEITEERLKEMKRRLRNNKGNIWHGWISFNEENSAKIDHPDKCVVVLKQTFGEFFKDAGFDESNIDLMCALHLDRETHLHIHYCFWEKEAKIKNERAAGYKYRAKGKVKMSAIDKMVERLNACVIPDELNHLRHEAILALSDSKMYSKLLHDDLLRNRIKKLAEALPKDKPLWYISKDMEPHRKEIDAIVELLCNKDEKLRKVNEDFLKELSEKKEKLQAVMGNYYKEQRQAEMCNTDEPKDESLLRIHTVEKLEWDYRRRMGNVLLKQIRSIQNLTFKRNPNKKYKMNDTKLKRCIAISKRKVNKALDGLFSSVADLFSAEPISYRNRLREIEEEMKAQQEQESAFTQEEQTPIGKWNWSK